MRTQSSCCGRGLCGVFLLGVLCLSLAGCSSKKTTITGKVTLNDHPVVGATVIFLPADEGEGGGTATTGDQGEYSITTRKPGKMLVAVNPPMQRPNVPTFQGKTVTAPPKDSGAPEEIGKRPAQDKLLANFPMHYANVKTSKLEFEVKPGKNEYDIPLHGPGAGRK